jgi:CheY-like chemotaxis protein
MTPWILVIDDDPGTRDALVAICQRAGYHVVSLEGAGREIEAIPSSPRFQVAVLDYHLPMIDGLEVARRLKQQQPECRIIMISSELPQDPEFLRQIAVVDHFLAKPFSKDAILEVIAQLCPAQAP